MGDDDEFEGFYLASYPRLVGQLAVVTGSVEDAEDVVQEAFARASVRWAKLRGFDSPEAWVRRVALNLATSGRRRTRRQFVLLARLQAQAGEPARSDDADRLALAAGLARLPVRHRLILALHYGADLPVEQVATQLRLPVGTVKSRLSRARAALGAYLDGGRESDEAREGSHRAGR